MSGPAGFAGCPAENLRSGDADPNDPRGHVGDRFCGCCGGRMRWQCRAQVEHMPGTNPSPCGYQNMVGMIFCVFCGAPRP